MGQWNKVKNGNMPKPQTSAPQSATESVRKRPKEVQITNMVVNGVPGIKIKLPF